MSVQPVEDPALRVLIIDDHRVFADAVKLTLEDHGVIVQGVATGVADGLRMVRAAEPDVVLVDIGLPDGSGLGLGQDILNEAEGVKVVAVTGLDDPRTIEDALRVGFSGYLTKDTPIEEFAGSVRAVSQGEVVVSRPSRWALDVELPEEMRLLASQLTPRELEVLSLLVGGLGGREIAAQLSISRNTVRTHVQNILTKLQVHSRLEATVVAVRHGITPQRTLT